MAATSPTKSRCLFSIKVKVEEDVFYSRVNAPMPQQREITQTSALPFAAREVRRTIDTRYSSEHGTLTHMEYLRYKEPKEPVDPMELMSCRVRRSDRMVLKGTYGGGISFFASRVDDSKRVMFTSIAPPWRYLRKGLNLEARCLNGECPSTGGRVWVQLGTGTFEIAKEIFNSKCPACGSEIDEGVNYGFWDCKYSFEGMMVEPERRRYEVADLTAPKDRFTLYAGSQGKWAYLTFVVKSRGLACAIL